MDNSTTSNPLLTDEALQYSILTYAGYLLASSVSSTLFLIFILLDARKVFERKAHWIPGQFLVLSALTIQLLTYAVHLNLGVISKDRYAKDVQMEFAVEDQLLMDSSRVMVCVFIAYMIPGMVRRGFQTVWSNIGALIFGVIFHIIYDLYKVIGSLRKDVYLAVDTNLFQFPDYRGWLIPSFISLFMVIIVLLGLLISAVIAGKTISKLMSQKVPLALSCCCNSPEESKCKNIEEHVLKCWIVVRASQPEYIIARSVLSASAGLLLPTSVMLLVVKWTLVPIPITHHLQLKTYNIQLAFVLVGSLVVVMRWLTAAFYFPRDVTTLFYREDFWTRSLVEMKEDARSWYVSLLLPMALWVQKLLVFFSKLCWCLSEIVFAIFIRPFRQNNISHQFSKYKEALDILRMPGETPYGLWIANERAFKQTENQIEQGLEAGTNRSAEMISLMLEETGPPEDETTTSMQEEKYFKEVAKNSWKMRGVSLIHFMMFFYDGTNSAVINDTIKAYCQAEKFLDIVDNSDPEAQLVSLAADKEFQTLENLWKKLLKMQPLQNPKKTHNRSKEKRYKLLEEKIKKPIREIMEQLLRDERVGGIEGDRNLHWDNLQDSMDWKTVAAKLSLFKTGKAVNLNINSNPGDAIHKLRCLLANIIVHCMENELDKALVESCNKWAKDEKENEIFHAAFIAGKAKGVWKCGKGKQGGEGKHTVQDQV